jgi:hypothetical protein
MGAPIRTRRRVSHVKVALQADFFALLLFWLWFGFRFSYGSLGELMMKAVGAAKARIVRTEWSCVERRLEAKDTDYLSRHRTPP